MSVSRKGDTVYTGRNGVRETLLREKAKLAKAPAGMHGMVVAPSTGSIREAVLAGICPFCGRDFKNLAVHTNLSHGVDAAELKALAGIPKSLPACHPSFSDDRRRAQLAVWTPERQSALQAGHEANKGRPRKYSEAGRAVQVKKLEAARQTEAFRSAVRRGAAKRRTVVTDRDREIARRAASGDSLESLADEFGIHARSVKRAIERTGVRADFRKQAAARRGTTAVRAASAARVANLAQERDEKLAVFARYGSDWPAAVRLAAECDTSVKSMVAYLRKHGAVVPDGRRTSELAAETRPRPRPKSPPKPCADAACAAPAKCRGMCSKRYQRWLKAMHRLNTENHTSQEAPDA